MTRRDSVTGMTDKELAALADQAYTQRDDQEAWEDQEPPEVSPHVRSVVSVRFSKGELGPIEAAAAAAGVPVSTYIRNAAINAVSPVDLEDARRHAAALHDDLQRLIGSLRVKSGRTRNAGSSLRRRTPAA